jgi:hypothetical protein
MQRRQICDRAVFDGGFDDPRTLVYSYQQMMRGQLLAKATAEANRRSGLSICLSQIIRAFRCPAAARPAREISAPPDTPHRSMPTAV